MEDAHIHAAKDAEAIKDCTIDAQRDATIKLVKICEVRVKLLPEA